MRRAVISFSGLMWLSGACAADKPEMGPAPSWVEAVASPADDGTGSDAAVKFLLTDWQVNFSGATVEAYFHNVVRVQTPQGLATAGTISLPWNPATDSLTVHHLQILRGGQMIDVLAGGPNFTVLRRENSLEYAALNGVLTAVIQPPGLQVGDQIDLAFSVTRSDPILGGNSEMVVTGWPALPIARLSFIGRWASPNAVRWWASDVMPKMHETRHGDVTEVRFELDNPAPPPLPSGSPSRFKLGRHLQFSTFSNWQKISERLAPLYVQAAKLSPQSALNAEVARIRAATPDPGQRALAALALVQDQVRYVFLGMNEGAMVPADADLTWSRRFGDCKGKTALLLALLRELGISAEPVAVNVLAGDSVKVGLPMVEAFNHVLVRASVGGKFYWLDGARSGDRNLSDLAAPPYYWGLPLVPGGSNLVQIVTEPPTQPQDEVILAIDASGGIPGPAPLHGELVFRGQAAAAMRFTFGNLSAADRDKVLHTVWNKVFPAAKLDSVVAKFDEQAAEEHLTMDGSLPMDWSGERLQLEGLDLTYNVDLTRADGPHSDAPFTVPFPRYSRGVETIKLPQASAPFTVEGDDIHRSIGGVEFKREAHVRDGVLTAEESARSLAPEITHSEGTAAHEALKEVTGAMLYLHAPAGYVAKQREGSESPPPPELLAPAPQTVEELIRHGNDLLDKGQYDSAIRDFDKALQLEPRSALALADRGMVHVWKNEVQLARADLDAAAAIEPGNAVVPRGRGVLALRAGRAAEAVGDFTEGLRLEPESTFALQWRAEAYRRSGENEKALSDSAEVTRLRPHLLREYSFRESLLRRQGRTEEALHEADAVIAANADQPAAYVAAAGIYMASGKANEAMHSLDRSLEISPTLQAYLMRASYRPKTDLAGRQTDLEAAVKLEPRSTEATVMLAGAQSDAGKYADAENTLKQGIAVLGKVPDLLIQRGIIYARQGRHQLAAQDFAAVREKYTDPQVLNSMCWAIATAGVALDTALSACEAAVARRPQNSAFLDSRGFVLLRLGRYDEAIAAYDAAIKIAADTGMSLYGRGVSKRRKGDLAGGDADLKAALALNRRVADTFADYGVTP